MCELDPDAVKRVTATERRDDGMHAWEALAFNFAAQYVQSRETPFNAESMIEAARKWGVPDPPDCRAESWHTVIERCRRQGLIHDRT